MNTIIPLILGGGIPLFTSPGSEEQLELIDSTKYPSGLAQVHYRSRRSGGLKFFVSPLLDYAASDPCAASAKRGRLSAILFLVKYAKIINKREKGVIKS